MTARDLDAKSIRDLTRAVFIRAVKDYVILTARGLEHIAGVGSRKEIEQYLNNPLAEIGSRMHPETVARLLKSMTKDEAMDYLKLLRNFSAHERVEL